MDKEYFKKYYRYELDHWWFRARLAILSDKVSQLSGNRPLKILNVGAATGATTKMLEKFGQVTTVEYDHDCCGFLKSELGIDAIEASITALPFADRSFDLVCAFDVVEHVEDDAKACSELMRVVNEHGHVFCTVPAFMFLWSDHDVINHHFRRYTSSSFDSLFKGIGNIRFSGYFNFWLFAPIAAVRLLGKLFGNKKQSPAAASNDFEIGKSGFISSVLYFIFKSEGFFIRKNIRLPFGVSYLLIATPGK